MGVSGELTSRTIDGALCTGTEALYVLNRGSERRSER